MWQLWIDTGGTFTDGLALAPDGALHRTKVLSSSRLRARLTNGRLTAPWLTAPLFAGYQIRVVATDNVVEPTPLLPTENLVRVVALTTDGRLITDRPLTDAAGEALPGNVVAHYVAGHGTHGVHAETGPDVVAPSRNVVSVTVELTTGEEAPVLAARLLTQTPLGQPFPALTMRLGTTRGTNALLERRGARVALLVTRGFADLLRIGTQQRPHLFQLAIPPAEVLYHHVVEVDERVDAAGNVVEPLAPTAVEALIGQVQSLRPDAVAVSLLNAYCNPAHEQQLGTALHRAGFHYVTRSTDVATTPGYVARTQTAVVDAYLTPVLRAYLDNVQRQLGSATVRVMSSAGGLVRADLFRPKDSLLSGPAGGVIGSAAVAGSLGFARVLTLDMGGTSTDAARIDGGTVDYRFTTFIDPFELHLPALAIETVAAGGGSVCWLDTVGQLRVGPHSAGASPGPACYGAGRQLTLTDVNLLLGKLHPARFGIPIFRERAETALHHLLDQIEQRDGRRSDGRRSDGRRSDVLGVLRGLERIADEAMAGAIRRISVAQGFDPADYALLVFGGAGGLHGCAVAELLGIRQLILPFDAGLLSAYGMGQATTERLAERAVLQPLANVVTTLPTLVAELSAQALATLRHDVGPGAPVGDPSVRLYLRLLGQAATVAVPLPATTFPTDLLHYVEHAFSERYRHLYGHLPTNRPVEVESVRVRVATVPPTRAPAAETPPDHTAKPAFFADQWPAYDWTRLQPGDAFTGPALLLNTTSSAFIAPGWCVSVRADRNVVATAPARSEAVRSTTDNVVVRPLPAGSVTDNGLATADEVVQAELFTQRFRAIADEMGAQLQRTAFSTNVKERLDFSCALLDEHAELIVNAPHIPVHLGSLGVCARLCLAELPLGPGDVLITNHPRWGGSHLPDVTLLQGVFTDAGERIGYVINRAHHAEIGGKVPGSMPPDATRLSEEGVVLEPQYVVRAGVLQWDALERRFAGAPYPTRALAENRADIEAALASLRAGETALRRLAAAHGLTTVRHYVRRLKAAAAEAMRSLLTPLNGQSFEALESLDDGHAIRVRIHVADGRVRFDFRGTAGVHPRNLNANVAILHSAVLYVLRLWCANHAAGADIPLNEGLMAPVELILPDQSLLNPAFPTHTLDGPAVVGGNTEVSQRLVDTLLKALGLAACSQGTMNNFLFGRSGAGPDAFGYYETIGGGAGATVGADGRSGVHQHMTNTRLTDPEELERRYPVRLRRFSLRRDSGGAGRWPGGDGLVREIEFLSPVQVTLLSQHRVVAPYGLHGGAPGAVGCQALIHPDGREEPLPGIFSRAVLPGTAIRLETPGGGGANEPAT